jgi:hypothetical protein
MTRSRSEQTGDEINDESVELLISLCRREKKEGGQTKEA